MKLYSTNILVLLANLFCFQFSDAQTNLKDQFAESLLLCVRIEIVLEGGEDYVQGAGIVVGRDKNETIIATAHHIFDKAYLKNIKLENIDVIFRINDKDIPVKATLIDFVDSSSFKDLALLRVNSNMDSCIFNLNHIGKDVLESGDKVYPIGNFNGTPIIDEFSEDRVYKTQNDFIHFKTNFIKAGDSGGGLLDENGYLIGMLAIDSHPYARAYKLSSIMEIVQQLGNKTFLDYVLPYGWTPLHKAAIDNELLQIDHFLNDCPKIDSRDDLGATALHYAARNGNVTIFRALLESGFNEKLKDFNGLLPIEWAIEKGNLKVVQFLVQKESNYYLSTRTCHKLLIKSISNGRTEIARFLLSKLNCIDDNEESDTTLLHFALSKSKYEIAEDLLKAGANVDIQNELGATPLAIAVKMGDIKAIKLLLKFGADPNTLIPKENTQRKITLLEQSINSDSSEMAELLLGSRLDITNIDNEYPRFVMKTAIKKRFTKVSIGLLERGYNPSARDDHGMPLLYYAFAEYQPNVIDAFSKAGYNINSIDPIVGDSFLHIIMKSVAWGTRVPDYLRNDVVKADDEFFNVLKMIIEAGAEVNIKNKNGQRPIDFVRPTENLDQPDIPFKTQVDSLFSKYYRN